MVNNRVHCPYCGSTAQVKRVGSPKISDNGLVLTDRLECGCGCHFTHDYKRNADGYWQIDWTQIEYIEKK